MSPNTASVRNSTTAAEFRYTIKHKAPYYQMAGWQQNINPEMKCNRALTIITRLRTGRSAVRVRAGAIELSILRNVPTGSGAHAVSYSMGTGASFPWCPFRHRLESARSPKLSCPSPVLFAYCKFFPFSSSPSTRVLPVLSLALLVSRPSTFVSYTCLCFLLLSILIWCPNS